MRRHFSAAPLALAALLSVWLSACGSQAPAPSETQPAASSQAQAQPGERRYHLEGTVVSIDKPQKHLVIDHKEIPGFMGAMTMPYPVADDQTLDRVGPGDQITGDVVVNGDGVHVDNVVVVKKGDGKAPKTGTQLQSPGSGDQVPNFMLVNQDGKQIEMGDYRGKTLLITFIYTRCPLPDYCPLMTHNFAQIEKTLAANPQRYAQTHLLSISIDPAYDTPAVLRRYGLNYVADKGKATFAHWEFACVTPAEMKDVLSFFNIFYNEQDGQISHSLRTAVISPDGKIFRWYSDSTWKPADLLNDVAKVDSGQPS